VGGSVKSAYAGGNIVCTKITLAPTPAPTPAPTYGCTCENGIPAGESWCNQWSTGPGANICSSCDDNYGLATPAYIPQNSKGQTSVCMRDYTLTEYGSCTSISEADCRNVAAIKGVEFLPINQASGMPGCYINAAVKNQYPWKDGIHWNVATQGPWPSCGTNGWACVCQ
jgi:hypothetical protein